MLEVHFIYSPTTISLLEKENFATVAHSFVTFKQDYCSVLWKRQWVQNVAKYFCLEVGNTIVSLFIFVLFLICGWKTDLSAHDIISSITSSTMFLFLENKIFCMLPWDIFGHERPDEKTF